MNLLFCSSVFTFYLCICTIVIACSPTPRRLAVNFDALDESQDSDEDDFMMPDPFSHPRSYVKPIAKHPVKTVIHPPKKSYTYIQSKPSYGNQKKPSVKKVELHKEKEDKQCPKLVMDEKNERMVKLPISSNNTDSWKLYLLFNSCEPFEDIAVSLHLLTFHCNQMANNTLITYFQVHLIPLELDSDTVSANWIADNLLEVKAKKSELSQDTKFIAIGGKSSYNNKKNKFYSKDVMLSKSSKKTVKID